MRTRIVVTQTDVVDLVRLLGTATNTDVARAFGWGLSSTTRGLESLVEKGRLMPVIHRADGTHPKLYRAVQ